MTLTVTQRRVSSLQLAIAYPTLALFEKEKGWRCGNSFISYRAKCYKNPKTGKIAYKTVTNPKTGRKNRVKVGLNYTEYQNARKKAVQKQGKGDRLTELEKKYIADRDRLAASTRKKKQRRVDAKRQQNKESQPKLIENYQGFIDTYKRIQSGDITAKEIQQAQQDLRSHETEIKAEINQKFKKPQLLRMAGWGARPSDKKERLVNDAYDNLEQALLPPGNATLSYAISANPEANKKARRDAIDKQMAKWSDELIQEKAKERKEAIASKEKAIKDPKTIDDFRTLIQTKGRDGLTVAQRAKYEDLVTLKNREERKKVTPKKVESVELPANKSFKLSKTQHTKKGHDLYVATLTERVDRDKYNELNRRAKQLGGYYSRYARDGAIPGFQFRDEESARKFMGLEEVENDRTSDIVPSSTNSLRSNAEKIIERQRAKLNQDRLVNTARRARMAANVEDNARAEIAIAQTMLNLADAKDEGNIQFLDRVKAGSELRQLNSILLNSRYVAARAIADSEYPPDGRGLRSWRYNDRVNRELEKPITDDTIEYAEYPYPSIDKDHLRNILAEVKSQPGMKLLANRLEKKYKAIANKDQEHVLKFEREKDIEDFRNLITKGKYDSDNYGVSWAVESLKDYDRVSKTLDLKTPYELRAGLRELNRLRSTKKSEDPIKTKERELIGRKIEGYFPTPKPVVDKMLELAELKTGERVLEPSAGKGNIADRIIEKVGNDTVSTIEIDPKLSEILDLKGYNNRRDDFLNITDEEYDKIIQNPPFEKLQDVDHVRHAYDLLAPGGKLVSVMSESPFFQQQKKAREFREWLAEKDGYIEKLPAGSFKNSERSTGVNTRLIVIFLA